MEKVQVGYMGNKLLVAGVIVVALLLIGQGCTKGDKKSQGENKENEKMIEEESMTDAMEMMKKDQVMGNLEVMEMMNKMEAGEDKMMKEVSGPEKGMMMSKSNYRYEGFLEDVSDSGASGLALATYDEGTYKLFAGFSGLRDPSGTDFYEGWIVRKKPFEFLSTGKVDKLGGVYTNTYQSGDNLTDHDFYVLTLEPDDGDPGPAAHIVEGLMLKK
jgi:hypothetical protein